MIRNRYILKVTSVFLSILTLNNIFLPTISYALTSGPTAPEYTSFEPVDTTDMVNLATGDFTYNIPLLEVPGPEGGYPLSLSYHAGIQPNEEASWVGLGWTLNPGAINRTVNGYPDDHYGVKRKVIDNWEGGDRSTYSVGVGVAGVNFGLSFSQDTYQGFGVGSTFGYGMNIGGDKSPLSIGANFSFDPYSGAYASGGLSLGVPVEKGSQSAAKLGMSVGVATNFKTVSAYAGVGVSSGGASLVGASISSNGLKPRFSVGGLSFNQVNSNAGRITSQEGGFNISIPVGYVMINLGYNYLRYYSNEESVADTWGTLYPVWKEPKDNSFDSYALLDPDAEGGIVENDQADKVLGGSMPAFDYYNVTGQGISGSIQPYFFQNFNMYRQNVNKVGDENDKLIEYKTNYSTSSKPLPVAFRFNNDFSNTAYFDTDPSVDRADDRIRFNNSISSKGTEGFNDETNHLAGSKHIEYFTNAQLNENNPISGFIYCLDQYPTEYQGYDISDQIGGFKITNESGITYHYALPVYTYDEHIFSETIDNERGKVFNRKDHPQPYAYTWLLTAITGPDYVNRGDGKTISGEDWGYWVKFEYGKWADKYQWRNPATGMHKDIDRNFQTYSRGKKELYYLDAIKTRTHTAFFIKEIREDGKGLANNDQSTGFEAYYTDEGESQPYDCGYNNEVCECTANRVQFPTSVLRLNKIILMKNEDYHDNYMIDDIKAQSDTYDHNFSYSNTCSSIGEVTVTNVSRVHFGDNVIDLYDWQTITNKVQNKILREVDFGHNYDLCKQTLNSFALNYTKYPTTSDFNAHLNKSGKLTLNKLKFLGKGGTDIIPPMTFGYEEEQFAGSMKVIRSSPDEQNMIEVNDYQNNDLEKGDILKFTHNSNDYYCLMMETYSSNNGKAKIINHNLSGEFTQPTSIQKVNKTKNPLYDKDAYDMWGSYKSDYEDLGNENLSRLTTEISARQVDVWSLKTIKTSLGSSVTIGYESDSYLRACLNFEKSGSVCKL